MSFLLETLDYLLQIVLGRFVLAIKKEGMNNGTA